MSISFARSFVIVIAFFVCPVAQPAEEHFLLGLHEARLLVEHTPAFLKAQQAGYCPQTSDASLNETSATIVVRSECKDMGVVGDFYVDVRTGTVTTDGGAPGLVRVETQKLASLRSKLLLLRAESRLTNSEALCLLASTPAALAIKESCRRIRIAHAGENSFLGSVGDSCATSSDRSDSEFSIDRYSGTMTDPRTGETYSAQTIEQIRQMLITAHTPVRLTIEDARRLAIGYRSTAQPDRAECFGIKIDPASTADEVWLQVWRRCGPQAEVRIEAVNLVNGSLRAINSNNSTDSAKMQALSQKLLSEARSRRERAINALRRTCE